MSDVAVMSAAPDDGVLGETSSRIRSELGAIGLGSHLVDCAALGAWDLHACGKRPKTESPAIETTPETPSENGHAPPPPPAVVISLGREDGVVTIEVAAKLADGSRLFRLVYVPAKEGGGDPSVLAVRAVELMRDVRLQAQRSDEETERATVTAAAAAAAAAPVSFGSGRWRATTAAALLRGRRGLGSSIAPALGISAAWGRHGSAFVTLTGPFFDDLSRTTAGVTKTAATRQELGMIGARYELGSRRVRPFGDAAAGLYHLRAAGQTADALTAPIVSTLWAPLVAGGVGAAVKLASFIALVAEADVIFTGPAGNVTIDDAIVGRAGGPSFLLQAGAWLFLP